MLIFYVNIANISVSNSNDGPEYTVLFSHRQSYEVSEDVTETKIQRQKATSQEMFNQLDQHDSWMGTQFYKLSLLTDDTVANVFWTISFHSLL